MKIKDRLHCGPVTVKRSGIHGYGVFAERPIKKGELVEECHVLIPPIKPNCFGNYWFSHDTGALLPLGFGAIYNHSNEPNLAYRFDSSLLLLCFEAKRDINVNEELFVSYGRAWFSERKIDIIMPFCYRYRHLLACVRISWRFSLVFGAMCGFIYFSNWLLAS